MQIKCAIASDGSLFFTTSRAPDQARRRIAEITGAVAHLVWIDLPADGVSSADHLEACASAFSKYVAISTSHLGSVWVCHPEGDTAGLRDRVRATADEALACMRAEAARMVEIACLTRKLATLNGSPPTCVV